MNRRGILGIPGATAADTSAPLYQNNGFVPTHGGFVELPYDEPITGGNAAAQWALSRDGVPMTLWDHVAIVGNVIRVYYSEDGIYFGEVVTISYTAGADPIRDLAGNQAANLSNVSIANNSTVFPE